MGFFKKKSREELRAEVRELERKGQVERLKAKRDKLRSKYTTAGRASAGLRNALSRTAESVRKAADRGAKMRERESMLKAAHERKMELKFGRRENTDSGGFGSPLLNNGGGGGFGSPLFEEARNKKQKPRRFDF